MRVKIFLVTLMLASLACMQQVEPIATSQPVTLSPTVTLTATAQNTPTPTKIYYQNSTQTPTPGCFVVSADTAVYLRPSPSDENYPISPLPNGTRLTDLGGRNGKWLFVEWEDKRGWVYEDYVMECQ